MSLDDIQARYNQRMKKKEKNAKKSRELFGKVHQIQNGAMVSFGDADCRLAHKARMKRTKRATLQGFEYKDGLQFGDA